MELEAEMSTSTSEATMGQETLGKRISPHECPAELEMALYENSKCGTSLYKRLRNQTTDKEVTLKSKFEDNATPDTHCRTDELDNQRQVDCIHRGWNRTI